MYIEMWAKYENMKSHLQGPEYMYLTILRKLDYTCIVNHPLLLVKWPQNAADNCFKNYLAKPGRIEIHLFHTNVDA